jgi:hypothetical protein
MDDELLDVLDEEGRPVGVKTRGEVHRDGDWHAAFHLWVVQPGGVLLQRRALTKDSWPGRLDATAAGHLTAGESVPDGLREADEELGVAFSFDALIDLGVHLVDERIPGDGRNRERQHVFTVRDARPLDAWTSFDRAELAGLVLIALEDFAVVARGQRAVAAREWNGEITQDIEVRPSDLVPSPYLSELPDWLAEQQA